ncbi:MAG: ShlB/FhaC/HecB family hemolysin secretion/activation protein [Candidatus Omnitrophica bacterium]|nr:ShlB/FhaC/HecB family hemolysin secretion/activation protein [Candidatus Omnitrophota bacterium]
MRKLTYLSIIVCAASLAFLFPINATAQNIPPGADTEASARRFQDESERRAAELLTKKQKAPKIDVQEKKAPAPMVSEVTFVLRDLKITGSTIFTHEDLLPLYHKYIDKEVSFKEINGIVEQIANKYKARGFLTTNVYIPEQQVMGGVVEIKILEGKVGKLVIEGNKWSTKSLIQKYIHSKKNELLNIFTLQRDLLRLNQNSDLDVKTVIESGEEPQTSDIILKVEDKFPYHVSVGSDNMGTRFTGKYRGSASFRATNFTANNDFVFFNSVATANSGGQFVTYMVPVTTSGIKAGFDFSYFTSKIGREFRDFDIVGNTLNYIPHVTGEIYLGETMQISADAGLNIKSTYKSVNSNTTVQEQLRIPYFRMDMSRMDSFLGGGQTVFSPQIELSIGNGFLGASFEDNPKASRAGTCGYYFKYTHTIRRIQRMPWESYISLRHQFQAANHTLPSSEQFQVGGMNTVRGYPEGDYLGDIAATVSTDWVFPMYLIPKDYKLPRDPTPLRNEIQPVIFMDFGGGGLLRTFSGEMTYKYLMGVGGGVKINLYNAFNVRLEWAQAIGSDPTANSGPSSFHMTANFEI